MTYSEMKTRFLIGYDAITNFTAPGYTDSEISGFLNQGMDLIVDELFAQNDLVNLAELLVRNSSTLSTCSREEYGAHAYEQNVGLLGYRWYVNSKLQLSRSEPFTVVSEWVPCELIPKPLIDKYVQTAFNKPIIVYPKVVHDVDTMLVFVDCYTTPTGDNDFQLTYIKTPDRIDVTQAGTIELHTRLHQKIVDKAIQLAMKATEAARADAEIKVNSQI